VAIFNFLGKDNKGKEESSFKPKSVVGRGSDGKFVSKNPQKQISNEPKEEASLPKTPQKEIKGKSVAKPKGPFVVTFHGSQVNRFFANSKWYFSVTDLLAMAKTTPPLEAFENLIKKEKYKGFEEKIKIFDEISCLSTNNAIELLTATGATFPGPIKKWLTNISLNPYVETPPAPDKSGEPVQQMNPSDRGV
jgi:hypothetical protein